MWRGGKAPSGWKGSLRDGEPGWKSSLRDGEPAESEQCLAVLLCERSGAQGACCPSKLHTGAGHGK